jgi:RNA ligase
MNSFHSYPSIFALGHKALASLLDGPVNVEEKIDGSQFSFGMTEDGELKMRSKGATLYPDAPEKMFTRAVATAKDLLPLLHPGWTYRAEYLTAPRHNALAYDRIPARHLIIFDINPDHEAYLPYAQKAAEAERIGLEVVPLLATGTISDLQEFRALLDTTSVLGGQRIEGVVVKPAKYDLFGTDKKVLMGKFVSEGFKEVHAKVWGESNPKQGDILDRIGARYNTHARWQKAVQHLTEAGRIEGSPRDIGMLIREVPADVLRECEEDMKQELWAWALPHLRRKVTAGLPEWYKELLLARQFEEAEA